MLLLLLLLLLRLLSEWNNCVSVTRCPAGMSDNHLQLHFGLTSGWPQKSQLDAFRPLLHIDRWLLEEVGRAGFEAANWPINIRPRERARPTIALRRDNNK